jgi:hypothetical protein
MKRTSGFIVMALGIVLVHRVALAQVLQTAGPAALRAAHSATSVVPAEDSGDDGDDDSGSDDSQ